MAQQAQNTSQPERSKEGITRITVGGFKSIVQEQSIEVRPLTILAGANSSGKSSIMQPPLLLKQTLEAPYDPGALLLNGPNVRFTSVDQLLSRRNNDEEAKSGFQVGIERSSNEFITTFFIKKKGDKRGFEVEKTNYKFRNNEYTLYTKMVEKEMTDILTKIYTSNSKSSQELFDLIINLYKTTGLKIERVRGFLKLANKHGSIVTENSPYNSDLEKYIVNIIHLPGLRGNPERTYPVSAISSAFPGTFENYVASVIEQWQRENDTGKLEKVNRDLYRLGLTSKVVAKAINDTQVEILVNRFPYHSQNTQDDMVNVADVGLGVSQALPVVVALHAANQEQLVYLEQPEIHLHPRAQSAMAEVLVDAVLEGKRVIVETHSSLLLLGIQTLVAEGKLPPEMVKLHWFTQQEDGSTKIDSADLDEAGAFGDWPEDFDRVSLDSEGRYIDAAHARLKGN